MNRGRSWLGFLRRRGWQGQVIVWLQAVVLFFGAWGAFFPSLAGAEEAVAAPPPYEEERRLNEGRLAQRQRFITTTRPSVVFTFGGFSKEAPLRDILEKMDAYGWNGTFFVTMRELERNINNIDLIVSYGHEIGIGLYGRPEDTFVSVCDQIYNIRKIISERYGIQVKAVRFMGGEESPALQEAVSAMGCALYGQGVNVVQAKHKEAQSVAEIMPDIFGKGTTALARGQIVYLRTDFYTNELLAGEMMLAVWRKKINNIAYRTYEDSPETNPANDSAYRVEAIRDVLADTGRLWKYPVDPEAIPPDLRPDYVPFEINDDNFEEEFYKRYIGAPDVNEYDRMTEFSRSEMLQADKTGIIKTVTDNTVFLTFDDWGNDDSVNHLLYVLRKHKVRGTFFIITWNMPNNPNLLRAIAEEGHEIASHTNLHRAMNYRNEKGKLVPGMGQEEYAFDVRESFRRLSETVGDVTVNGRRALTRMMRPPTLAVSRSGVRTNFDAGFTYIVSGSESTEDYARPDILSMLGAVQDGLFNPNGSVRRGSIIVMHMTAQAKFTPRALDLLLTENEKRPDGDPAKFRAGLLGDYLVESYSQQIRQLPAETPAH